jgi:threonyl-tRNA synthetase
MIIVGEKEAQSGQIAVRKRKKGDLGQFELKDFIDQVSKEIHEKVID